MTCSLATNNVLNPFTPFGDCSLIRMANLYANVARLGARRTLRGCLDMVTTQAAKLMNLPDYGIAVGGPADLVVLDCRDAVSAVAELSAPLFGLKNGRRSFTRAGGNVEPAIVWLAQPRAAAICTDARLAGAASQPCAQVEWRYITTAIDRR